MRIRSWTVDPFIVMNIVLHGLAVALCAFLGVIAFRSDGWAAWPGLLVLTFAGSFFGWFFGLFAIDLLADRDR